MRGELDVRVLEPDDEADRDVLLAHRVDPGAAELAVARPLAQRPAHGVDDPPQRLRDLPDLLDAERPDLGVPPVEAEVVDRRGGQVARGSLGEDGDPRGHVDAGLEVRERLPVLAAPLVARADAGDAPVVDEQLLTGGLRQDHRAARLRLLRQEAPELGDRDDPVAAVHHRRRRRDAERPALREEVDGLVLHLAVRRHVLDGEPPREQLADRARIHHRARQQVRSGLLALLEHRDGHLAELLPHVRVLLEQLSEPDGAREPARPAADDQDPDVDPLVRCVRRRADRLGVAERRREVGRADALHRSTGAPAGARSASARSAPGRRRRRGRRSRRSGRSGPC